jgi:hypothetical protein
MLHREANISCGEFCKPVLRRRLADVSYIHIYGEQDNGADNITSLTTFLSVVAMNKEKNNTQISGICFLLVICLEYNSEAVFQ